MCVVIAITPAASAYYVRHDLLLQRSCCTPYALRSAITPGRHLPYSMCIAITPAIRHVRHDLLFPLMYATSAYMGPHLLLP